MLCPRLMTGMCGGRAEDGEDRTGQGAVLAGAGRRGGGEDRAGDAGPPRSSSSSSASAAAGSGAWSMLSPVGGLRVGGVSTPPPSPGLGQTASRDAVLGGGLCCPGDDASSEEEEERRGRSKGEAGVAAGSSFSIMVEPDSGSSQLCTFFPASVSRAHSYRSNLRCPPPKTRTSLWPPQITRM